MALNYITHQMQWYKALYLARKYELSVLDHKYRPKEVTLEKVIEKQHLLENTLYTLEKEYNFELGTNSLTFRTYSDCILVFSRSKYNRPCTKLIKIFRNIINDQKV